MNWFTIGLPIAIVISFHTKVISGFNPDGPLKTLVDVMLCMKFQSLKLMLFQFQVNIPLMRQTELASGVDLRDEKGRRVCKSKHAARKGIGQVTE